jgi:hypothetical protein
MKYTDIFIYSSVDFSPERNAISIWIPFTRDSKILIDHIIKKSQFPNPTYFIEDGLLFDKSLMNEYNLQLYSVKSPKVAPSLNERKWAFYAHSDTLANSISKIISELNKDHIRIYTPIYSKEGAEQFFLKKGISYEKYSFIKLKQFNPDALILLNDWSKESRRIIAHCHLLQIPVICIQESIIDFGDQFKRMEHADYVFIQGAQTVNELNRERYFITGNPRYCQSQISKNDNNYILINCNFTYQIFENVREQWIADIIQILEKKKNNYLITQHPRDKADLSNYKNVIQSASHLVEEQLQNCKFLITRFSSLIHEAIVLKKPVIYYNPHHEKMGYDFEFNNEFLISANSPDSLEKSIELLNATKLNFIAFDNYLAVHCLPKHSKVTENISRLLLNYYFKPKSLTLKDIVFIIFLHPFLHNMYKKVKSILKPHC